MAEIETLVGLLVAVAALATVARWLGVPYPIPMVLGGLALAAIPGLPTVRMDPDIVFVVFVAPLVFATAWLTSAREVWANARPIGLLALGLLVITIVVVAAVARAAMPGLSWPAAFVLGTLVAPTDTVAVSAIAEQIALPRRLTTIVEGESMVDDATGLVAYRIAVAAAITGTFSIWQAGGELVLVTVGGVVIGLVVGWLTGAIWDRLDDPPVEITLSILAALAAYIAAEGLGVSGVVAVAVTGLYTGWRSPRLLSADTRVKAAAVWEVLVFVLNGLIFILVGLQLRSLDAVLAEWPPVTVLVGAVLVCVTTIVLRMVFVFPATYLPRRLSRTLRERDPSPSWRSVVVLGWTGMRGGDSMAAALALPFTIPGDVPFPGRDLIVALTFCVILVTIVLQGLTLPSLIRRLGLAADEEIEEREVEIAEVVAAQAALDRLDELESDSRVTSAVVDALRSRFAHLAEHDPDHADADDALRHAYERRVHRELIDAARDAVIDLRDQGAISDEALRETQRALDFEELRLGDEDDEFLESEPGDRPAPPAP